MSKLFYIILFGFLAVSASNNKIDNNRNNTHSNRDTIVIIKHDTVFINNTINIKNHENNSFLSSWNNTQIKQNIINFVKETTTKGSLNFIPKEYRVVTIDGDGTLWPEKPTYYQIEFVLYRIKQLEPNHPEWGKDKLLQAAINHNLELLRERYGVKGISRLMNIAQEGLNTDEFNTIINDWIKEAEHPTKNKLLIEMIYQPMKELINYLQEYNFKIYIVSNGGTDFIRALAKRAFNLPSENIIGSYQKLEYSNINNNPILNKTNDILFINNAETKPIAIHYIIGKKPVIAIGNSDNDIPMLKWSQSSKYNSLQILIHHTDSIREWAYDSNSNVGKLKKALNNTINSWLIIDMKNDWKYVYSYEISK